MQITVSERIIEMKKELNIREDVTFAKLAGTSKSVVGQWINGKIKSIHPRYAYTLEKKTGYNAKWILLGQDAKKSEETKRYKNKTPGKDAALYEQIIRLIQSLSEKDIIIIYNLLKVMVRAQNDNLTTTGMTKIKKRRVRKTA